MSVASEITRINNAKESIKTSIENKGVTVPSTAKIDGYATLIDSIPSGGSEPTTTSLNDIGTQCAEVTQRFKNYLIDFRNNYAVGTNEQTTLYSPAQYYDFYYIKRRTDGKYNILWGSFDSWYIRSSQLYQSFYNIQRQGALPYNPSAYGNVTNSADERTGFEYNYVVSSLQSTGNYYYSQNYNTLEEALSAIKSSSTTYTLYSSGSSSNINPETPYKVAYTNGFIFNYENNDYVLCNERKISSNETIQYIS